MSKYAKLQGAAADPTSMERLTRLLSAVNSSEGGVASVGGATFLTSSHHFGPGFMHTYINRKGDKGAKSKKEE